jgi:CBS domain containing-hemolysin-like protein
MGIGFEILTILLLVGLNGIFAMSELAIVSSRGPEDVKTYVGTP